MMIKNSAGLATGGQMECEHYVEELWSVPFLKSQRIRTWVGVVVAVLVSSWPFAPGISFSEFLVDDRVAIVDNNDVTCQNLSMRALFSHDYWGNPIFYPDTIWTHKSFRPLTTLTFRWNYLLHGFKSSGFHATNCLLHVFVSFLVGDVAMAVLHLPPIACSLAAGIFAVHPVHVENLHNVVGRADILAALFMLISLRAYSAMTKDRTYADHGSETAETMDANMAQGVSMSDTMQLHPVEATHSSTEHLELLCGVKSAAVYFVRAMPRSFVSVTFTMVLIFIAGLCKEVGFTTIGVLIAMDVVRLHEARVKWIMESAGSREVLSLDRTARHKHICSILSSLWRLILIFAEGATLIYWRYRYTQGTALRMSPQDNPVTAETTLTIRILSYARIHGEYARLLLPYAHWAYDASHHSIPLVKTPFDVALVPAYALYIVVALMVIHFCNCWVSALHAAVAAKTNWPNSTCWRLSPSGSTKAVYYERTRVTKCLQTSRVLGISIAVTIATFMPASNVFFPVGTVVAERLIYLPSIGCCWLVGALASPPTMTTPWVVRKTELQTSTCFLKPVIVPPQSGSLPPVDSEGPGNNERATLRHSAATTQKKSCPLERNATVHIDHDDPSSCRQTKRQASVMVCLVILWVLLAFACRERTAVWRDGETLFVIDGYGQPMSAKTQFNLGITYFNMKQWTKAKFFLRRSIAIDSTSVMPYWRLGQILIIQGRFHAAKVILEQCLGKISGSQVVKDEEILNDIAVAQNFDRSTNKAVETLRSALALNHRCGIP
eukprot:GHVT01047886.1.p1 GENE.GHVT01047886.1~~GHVT01047886.1.p1  ORF type:complete len:778 (+),score=3.47 GHVT01047886.1:316-2649(+)